MELKYNTPEAQRARYEVLIVPLWNWNVAEPCKEATEERFNRTFMELKLKNIGSVCCENSWF